MFHASGHMDRHDEAYNHLLKLARSPNMIFFFHCSSVCTQNAEKFFIIKVAGRSEQDVHFMLQIFSVSDV
jgi:hypothetical protein